MRQPHATWPPNSDRALWPGCVRSGTAGLSRPGNRVRRLRTPSRNFHAPRMSRGSPNRDADHQRHSAQSSATPKHHLPQALTGLDRPQESLRQGSPNPQDQSGRKIRITAIRREHTGPDQVPRPTNQAPGYAGAVMQSSRSWSATSGNHGWCCWASTSRPIPWQVAQARVLQ